MLPLLHTNDASGQLMRRRWQLAVESGIDRGKRCEIDRTPIVLGAAPAAALVITDDTVSRYHVEIDAFADGLRIRDLDSTNGTFIGDQKIKDGFVEPGGYFRIGRTEIKVIGTDELANPEFETEPGAAPPGAIEMFGDALAVSPALRTHFLYLKKIAASPSPVFLEGEPGSGKATSARTLHDLGPRSAGPFIHVTLEKGIQASLVDELCFGGTHAKDARASSGFQGAFERATGGTLFIEAIEQMPTSCQDRLCSALESGEVQRLGDDRRRRVDVRLITSSSTPFENLRLEPAFLKRIGVVRLALPPLRERIEDVVPLARKFLIRKSGGKLDVGAELKKALLEYHWPGNLDQLRLFIEQVIEPGAELDVFKSGLKKALVIDTLTAKKGDVTRAAEELGFSQKALFQYLVNEHIELAD